MGVAEHWRLLDLYSRPGCEVMILPKSVRSAR